MLNACHEPVRRHPPRPAPAVSALPWVDHLTSPIPAIPASRPRRVVRDHSEVAMSFNVMPGRSVSETLHIREYRVWDDYAEADFDRTYSSAMEASPSHLVFLTGLAHAQKLLYMLMAHRLGRDYDPNGDEFGKFWVTDLRIHIPKMVRQEKNLTERLWILDAKQTGASSWTIDMCTSFCDSLVIWARTPLFLL